MPKCHPLIKPIWTSRRCRHRSCRVRINHRRGATLYPSKFDYLAPESLEEALAFLAERGDDVKILAGGQSLIPMMKLRFA
ncbi:MAG: FAD binding domain-containing protein, partial [Acidimicrobiia bacterium]